MRKAGSAHESHREGQRETPVHVFVTGVALFVLLSLTEQAAGVYHRESRQGRYQLTYKEAKAVCKYEGGKLATYKQLEEARQIGLHLTHTQSAHAQVLLISTLPNPENSQAERSDQSLPAAEGSLAPRMPVDVQNKFDLWRTGNNIFKLPFWAPTFNICKFKNKILTQ